MLIAVLFLFLGNGRRTSHNPPEPMMLDIYDRVGMVVMDENGIWRCTTAGTKHEDGVAGPKSSL